MSSEFELIRALRSALRPGDAPVGPGDDAAILWLDAPEQALSTDLLVEGVHFRRHYAAARDVGYRAAAVTLSDLAAMGARPHSLTVAVGTPESDLELFRELGGGLQDACGPHGCAVVGGDVSRSPVLLLCTTGLGRVRTGAVLRSGGRPGDLLAVTGRLGEAAAGLRALEEGRPGVEELKRRHLRPSPRVEAGARLAEAGLATAMIDLSDGLLQDLGHLCDASGVEARVDLERLPLSPALLDFCREAALEPLELACSGGEDFELLFAFPPGQLGQVREAVEATVPVRVIGELLAADPEGRHRVRLWREGREATDELPWVRGRPGYDHFRP